MISCITDCTKNSWGISAVGWIGRHSTKFAFYRAQPVKGLPFISSSPFNQLALEMQSIERKRCNEFNAQVLESFAVCPYCRFPEDSADATNISGRILAIHRASWTNCGLPGKADYQRNFNRKSGCLCFQPLTASSFRNSSRRGVCRKRSAMTSWTRCMNWVVICSRLNWPQTTGWLSVEQGQRLNWSRTAPRMDDYINQITQDCQRDLVRIKIKID